MKGALGAFAVRGSCWCSSICQVSAEHARAAPCTSPFRVTFLSRQCSWPAHVLPNPCQSSRTCLSSAPPSLPTSAMTRSPPAASGRTERARRTGHPETATAAPDAGSDTAILVFVIACHTGAVIKAHWAALPPSRASSPKKSCTSPAQPGVGVPKSSGKPRVQPQCRPNESFRPSRSDVGHRGRIRREFEGR